MYRLGLRYYLCSISRALSFPEIFSCDVFVDQSRFHIQEKFFPQRPVRLELTKDPVQWYNFAVRRSPFLPESKRIPSIILPYVCQITIHPSCYTVLVAAAAGQC